VTAAEDPAEAGVTSSVKEAPPSLFDVFSFETDPDGSAGKDSVVGHTDLPPPEGSRWIQFASESKPVALPEHVIQSLINEKLSDEDDIHRVLSGLLQMFNQRQLSTEARKANEAAMEAMRKAKRSHKMEVDEKRKETEKQVGQYKVKREADITELEDARDQMMQQVDEEFEQKKKEKRLDENSVLADWKESITSLSGDPVALMKNCVAAAQNLKINDAFRQETQYRIAVGIDVCGNHMQKHIAKLKGLLDMVDDRESDTINFEEDLGYWMAVCQAMQHLKTNMPYSPVEEDKMSDAVKRKYKSDLASAEQNAANHLWDGIYKFYPCPGCHAKVLAASYRGGPDGAPEYYKEMMDGFDCSIPCVNSFLPCPVTATVAGSSSNKRYYSNANAEFGSFGAINTHERFPELDPEVYQLTNEELIAAAPAGLKKYLNKDGKIPKELRKLNAGKPPIGADPVTDAHLSVVVLEMHQLIEGSRRCFGFDTGMMIRAMGRMHDENPGIAVTEMIFGFYNKMVREQNNDGGEDDEAVDDEAGGDEAVDDEAGGDEAGGDEAVDGETGGDGETADSDDDRIVTVDGSQLAIDSQKKKHEQKSKDGGEDGGETTDTDEESMLAVYGSQKKKKRKQKSNEGITPIDDEPKLLDAVLRFLNGDKTALISTMQPASADSVLRQDQKDDMLTASITSSQALRERLQKASDEYWKLMAREDLTVAEKNEIVDCQVNKIFTRGFGRLNPVSGKMYWNDSVEGDEGALLGNFEGPNTCVSRVRCPRVPPPVMESWRERKEIDNPLFAKIFQNCVYPKEFRLANLPNGKKSATDWKNIAAGRKQCVRTMSALVERMEKFFDAQNKKNKGDDDYEPMSVLNQQDVENFVNRVRMPHNWTVYEVNGRPGTEKYEDNLAEADINFPEKFRPKNCTDLMLMQRHLQAEAIKDLREDIVYATKLTRPKGRPRGSGKRKKGGGGSGKRKKGGGGPSQKPKTVAEEKGVPKCMILPDKTKPQQSDIDTTLKWKSEMHAKLRERQSDDETKYSEAEMVAVFKCFGPGYKEVTEHDIMEGFYTPDFRCIIRDGGIPWSKAQKIYKVADVEGGNPYREEELKLGNCLKLPSDNKYVDAIHYAVGHIKVEMARAQGARVELAKRAQKRKRQSDAIAARSEQNQRATVVAQQEELVRSRQTTADVQKAADEAQKVADEAKKGLEAKLDAAKKAETDAKQVADAELAAARKATADQIAVARKKASDDIAAAMEVHNAELAAMKAELAEAKKAREDEKSAEANKAREDEKSAAANKAREDEKSAAANKAREDEKSAAANKARVDDVVAIRAKRAREDEELAARTKKARVDDVVAAGAKRPREDEELAAGAKKATKPSDEAIRWANELNLAREAQIESTNNMVKMGLIRKADTAEMIPAKVTPADYYLPPVADGARP
jgi:hypothetical protein